MDRCKLHLSNSLTDVILPRCRRSKRAIEMGTSYDGKKRKTLTDNAGMAVTRTLMFDVMMICTTGVKVAVPWLRWHLMLQAGGRTLNSVALLLVPAEGSIAVVATTDELTGVEIFQQSSLIGRQIAPESQAMFDFIVDLDASHYSMICAGCSALHNGYLMEASKTCLLPRI